MKKLKDGQICTILVDNRKEIAIYFNQYFFIISDSIAKAISKPNHTVKSFKLKTKNMKVIHINKIEKVLSDDVDLNIKLVDNPEKNVKKEKNFYLDLSEDTFKFVNKDSNYDVLIEVKFTEDEDNIFIENIDYSYSNKGLFHKYNKSIFLYNQYMKANRVDELTMLSDKYLANINNEKYLLYFSEDILKCFNFNKEKVFETNIILPNFEKFKASAVECIISEIIK